MQTFANLDIEMIFIPEKETIERSKELHSDSFYKMPRIIECFVDRANGEVPKDWHLLPWTLNRSVSLFHKGSFVLTISYDDIENNIVAALDRVQDIVKHLKKENCNE